MWPGILFVAVIMAAGTLMVLDASFPGGLIAGSGNMRYAQTMAFTTLMVFQLFNVFNARSDERSAFVGLFHNGWVWAAVGLALVLHVAVLYTRSFSRPFPRWRCRLATGLCVARLQAPCCGSVNYLSWYYG